MKTKMMRLLLAALMMGLPMFQSEMYAGNINQFLSSMDHARFQTNEKGVVITNCVYYAYCLMSNQGDRGTGTCHETVGSK
jgi:hypothetical protein